ncbi:MAG TPA: cupin domain-containing protein [Usitatibacter sp.]|nr:cupin domain-containing protein [Usitatibacter sp.]
MTIEREDDHCIEAERVALHALRALPAEEAGELEAHVASCARCRRDLEDLRGMAGTLLAWPADLLRPARSLQSRLAERIAEASGTEKVAPPAASWNEPEWDEVSPGIFCKLLANDSLTQRVSMLVRLLPGVEYPPHTHAGIEELHLLEGELWIDDRKLYPGDYNRAEAPTGDKRVWSETGCTCVLITSTEDILS